MRKLFFVFHLLLANFLFAQSDSTYIKLAEQALNECRQGEYESAITNANLALQHLLKDKPVDVLAAQNAYLAKAFAYSGQGENKSAKAEYAKNLELIQTHAPDSLDWLSMGYFRVGVGQYQYDEIDEAIISWEKATDLRSSISDSSDVTQAFILSNLGVGALVKGDNFAAVDFLEKAVDQYQNSPKEDGSPNLGVFNPLLNLGASYRAIGNSNAAIANLEKAIEYIDQIWDSPQIKDFPEYYLHSSLGSSHRNLSYVYNRLEMYETSISYSISALNEYKKAYGDDHPEYVICLSDLGHIHALMENFEEAETTLQKGMILAKKLDRPNLLAHLQYNLSRNQEWQGNLEQAIEYQIDAVKNADLTGEENMTVAFREILAHLFLKTNQPKKALAYLQENVEFLKIPMGKEWSPNAITENVNVLRTLGTLGATYLKRYQTQQDPADLDQAEQVLDQWTELMVEAASKAVLNSDEELINTFYHSFESAIATQYEQYQRDPQPQFLEKAWQLTEMSRATRLRDNIAAMKAEAHPNVPVDLIKKERLLNADLLYFRRKIETAEGEEQQKAKTKLFKTQNEYKALKENLANNYPEYFRLRYSNQTIELSPFQAALPSESTWVSYFIGDEYIFTWVVDQAGADLLKIEKSKNFEKQMSQLREGFLNPSMQDFEVFQKSALAFKNKYVDNAIAQRPNEKLIFSLDGALNYIPIEALPTAEEGRYFIHEHMVSYASSASLWFNQNQNMPSAGSKSFVGFAPDYNNFQLASRDSVFQNRILTLRSNGQFMLPHTQLEVDQIANLVNGKSIVGKAANRDRFLKEISDYQVIHIAAHGLVDDINPLSSCLLFSNDAREDSRLYAGDIYQIDLNAQLAVLSACNTGYGKLQRGEGMMGMAHAFNFAGVASTLVSLWSVPDKQTSTLMVDFYQHLKNGANKDEALRQAKINYLDQQKNKKAAHPYFWAGFVLHGNTNAISFSSTQWWRWILGGMILLGIGFFVKRGGSF